MCLRVLRGRIHLQKLSPGRRKPRLFDLLFYLCHNRSLFHLRSHPRNYMRLSIFFEHNLLLSFPRIEPFLYYPFFDFLLRCLRGHSRKICRISNRVLRVSRIVRRTLSKTPFVVSFVAIIIQHMSRFVNYFAVFRGKPVFCLRISGFGPNFFPALRP